jgi:hypothetical protein
MEWSELSLSPAMEEGGGTPPRVLTNRRQGPVAVYMYRENVDPWSAVISTSRDLLHCLTAGWLSALWFIGFFGDKAAALGGGRSYNHRPGDCPA